jgi:hypothetical protein
MRDEGFTIAGLAVDAQRSVIIAGAYGTAHDFGGQTLIGDGDAYVAKYDPDGALVWASGLGRESNAFATSLAVSTAGQIYMAAYVNSYLRTPQGATLQQGNVLAAYDTAGTLVWVYALPFAAHLVATSDGGAVLGGVVEQSTMLGGTTIDLTRDGDYVVAKVDPSGHFQWVYSLGAPGVRHSMSELALGDADRVAVTMNLHGEMPTEALLDAGGVVWTAQAPKGAATANAIATYEDLVLTTGTGSPIDLGNGTMVGSLYLAARDGNGALVDARAYGDPTLGRAQITALATGPNGELAFAGATTEPIDFGGGPLAGPALLGGQNLILGIIDAP